MKKLEVLDCSYNNLVSMEPIHDCISLRDLSCRAAQRGNDETRETLELLEKQYTRTQAEPR